MKKISTLILGMAAAFGAWAQAPVPTSYDFENGGTYPTGWTLNPLGAGTQYYTTSFACGNSAYSLKLDSDNENLVIFLASQPGVVSYNIRANTGGATPFAGTFNVQESPDGTTWTDIKTYTNGQLNINNCVADNATPTNPASRYIRFFFTNKQTGNVGLDDINIAAPVVAVGIKVTQASVQIANGGYTTPVTSPVSTTTPFALDIANIGATLGLDITSAAVTGTNASEFVVSTTTPFTVATGSSTPLNIDFTPMASGTREAILTLSTSDPNNATFVVNMYGVGGTLATEPTAQATGLSFPINKTYRVQGTFTTASPAVDALGGYLILRQNGGPVTDVPVDGATYQRGQYIGTSQVVYAGPIAAGTGGFTPTYIRAAKTYGFAVFTYNGNGSVTNYNTTAPLAQTVTTPATMMPAGEYSSVNTAAATFVTDLSAHTNPHQFIYYSNYAPTMIDKFETRDTFVTSPVIFTRAVTCAYSGYQRPYNEPFDWTALDFSREHTFCHNWMPTNPADNPEKPEYNDQHNLYPTRQTNVNATRSNYPLGEVVTVQTTFGGCKFGLDAAGNQVFEPRDEHKGNAARAIMYESICYNGISGNNWSLPNPISVSIPYGQDQTVLKKWHYQDPPDSYEIARNDFLDSLQGNRNPFIDSVQYACYVDFYTMTKIVSPTIPCNISTVGVKEKYNVDYDYSLFPNPSNGTFSVLLNTANAGVFTVKVIDMMGRVIDTQVVNGKQGNNYISFEKNQLPAGAYLIETTTGKDKLVKKLIVQ